MYNQQNNIIVEINPGPGVSIQGHHWMAICFVVVVLLALFSKLMYHPIFHERDVIDLSMEQMCELVAIHDVTQHSVAFGDVLSSELS